MKKFDEKEKEPSFKIAKKAIFFQQNKIYQEDQFDQDQSDPHFQQISQYQYEGEAQEKRKQNKKKVSKRRTKKSQENQGLRIAKQRKIEYLFRNICNPNGNITIESLGKALLKHKIQFKISQLQQMILLCDPDKYEQDSVNIDSDSIANEIKSMNINLEKFRQFYQEKF